VRWDADASTSARGSSGALFRGRLASSQPCRLPTLGHRRRIGRIARAIAEDSPRDVATATTAASPLASPSPSVVEVVGLEQFLQALEENSAANPPQLVIADFHATWCAACRKVQPMLEALAAERADVTIVKIAYDQNKELCRSLGVKKLPFFHVYRGGRERLESFSASKKTFHRVLNAVAIHAPAAAAAKEESPK